MRDAVKFLIRPIYRRYQALHIRVSRLETAVDCMLDNPKWVESEEIGFNGQRHRKRIFQELLEAFKFDAIIETGTWIGNTTGYMAKTSHLPIYTCELDKRFSALAKTRLQGISNITFWANDSRTFLSNLSIPDESKLNRVFIYLDAHGYEDLPLQGELEIICNRWKEFVIMIDDFQVPGDQGYGYDNYGKRKTLSLDVFSGVLAKYELNPFFPTLASGEETGAKRGCVVLARKGALSEILGSIPSLCKKDF